MHFYKILSNAIHLWLDALKIATFIEIWNIKFMILSCLIWYFYANNILRYYFSCRLCKYLWFVKSVFSWIVQFILSHPDTPWKMWQWYLLLLLSFQGHSCQLFRHLCYQMRPKLLARTYKYLLNEDHKMNT